LNGNVVCRIRKRRMRSAAVATVTKAKNNSSSNNNSNKEQKPNRCTQVTQEISDGNMQDTLYTTSSE
jgi:hypothetical protein